MGQTNQRILMNIMYDIFRKLMHNNPIFRNDGGRPVMWQQQVMWQQSLS